jgi:flavin reductase (DIM6/NTAB) family NADH-FMN oxidoreductase RutF
MDLEAKKIALRKIPHGVYVVGVRQNGQINAFTGTWFSQVSFTPPLVALGVKKDSHSFAMIQQDRVFSVNFLGKNHKHLAEHFVKPASVVGEKLSSVAHTLGKTGTPLLEEAIAYLECEVREIANALGDHAVVIGEVVEACVRNKEEAALTLMDTGWHYGG